MVVAYDARPAVAGFGSDANEPIPGDVEDVLPAGDDDAELADGVDGDAPASAEPEAPFDLTSLDEEQRQWLDTHYQTQSQERFQQQLSEAMRTRDRENNDLRTGKQQAESRQFALNAALQVAMRQLQQYAEATGDEVSFYKARDAISGAMQGATQQAAAVETNAVNWVASEHHQFQQRINKESVGPDGQRLFDPNTPELQEAFTQYAQAAYRDRSQWTPDGSYNPIANRQAAEAFERLEATKDRLRFSGVKSQAQLDLEKKAKEAKAVQARRKERGPQSTGRGTGTGGMSGEAAWDASGKEYPNDQTLRHARYLQLKYGNSR